MENTYTDADPVDVFMFEMGIIEESAIKRVKKNKQKNQMERQDDTDSGNVDDFLTSIGL